jgi:hypothetical protein
MTDQLGKDKYTAQCLMNVDVTFDCNRYWKTFENRYRLGGQICERYETTLFNRSYTTPLKMKPSSKT